MRCGPSRAVIASAVPDREKRGETPRRTGYVRASGWRDGPRLCESCPVVGQLRVSPWLESGHSGLSCASDLTTRGDTMKRRALLQSIAAAPIVSVPLVHNARAQAITLHGAVQFNDDHAFNRALLKFEELVKKYYGKPINFLLHRNSELGLEKQYF